MLCLKRCQTSSSSSSSIIARPLSRITTMGGVHTAQGVWRSCVWNAVTVSALKQASGREFHSGTVLTKNECLYWAVCDRMCLNLKLWWCLVLRSAGSKIASACTGMLHLTILNSMASRISHLRPIMKFLISAEKQGVYSATNTKSFYTVRQKNCTVLVLQ